MRPVPFGASRYQRGTLCIRGLFARLTGGPKRGEAMYRLAVDEARRPYWFIEGEVPDTRERTVRSARDDHRADDRSA